MKIRAELAYPPNNWTAVDDETYDGPGSIIGSGASELEAVQNLMSQLEDNHEGRATLNDAFTEWNKRRHEAAWWTPSRNI